MARKKRISSLEVEEVSLVSAPANPESVITLFKSAATVAQEEKMPESDVAPVEPVVEAAVEPIAAAAPEATPEVAPVAAAAPEPAAVPEPAVEPVAAAAAPAAETVPVEKHVEEVEKARVKIEELEKALATQSRIAKVRDAKDRVVATMKSIPVTTVTLSENLVALAEKDAALAAFVEETLVKASALIEKGGLGQVAETGHDADAVMTAEERVAKLAAKLMAENPKLTKAAAEASVWKSSPDLYAQYEQEKAGR